MAQVLSVFLASLGALLFSFVSIHLHRMIKYIKKKFEHPFLLFICWKIWMVFLCGNTMVSWFLDVWFNFYLYKCISNFFSSILLLTSSLCLEENTNTACPQRITYLLPLTCTWMASSCSFISCLLLEKPKNNSLSKGFTMQGGQSNRDKLNFRNHVYSRLEFIWGSYHLL